MTLENYHTLFQSLPNDKKYEFIRKFKRVFSKNPNFKADGGHPIFIAIIEFHISVLKKIKKKQ